MFIDLTVRLMLPEENPESANLCLLKPATYRSIPMLMNECGDFYFLQLIAFITMLIILIKQFGGIFNKEGIVKNKEDDPKQLVEVWHRIDLFFKETLDEAIRAQRSDISETASAYLLLLLVKGLRADRPNAYAENKTVAEEFSEATLENNQARFRQAGDRSLITAGIWWQSLFRKIVGIDYYITIGSKAYRKASESERNNLSELFDELSSNFNNMVNILAKTTQCISEARMTNGEILQIYEIWLRTHNPMLADKLRSLGINPVDVGTTKQ